MRTRADAVHTHSLFLEADMAEYLVKRIIMLITVLFGVLLLISSLTYLIPGDPATIMLQQKVTPEIKEMVRQKLGLDQPIFVRFFKYIWNVLHGDFGVYVMNGRPVLPVVLSTLPHTFTLATFSMAISLFFGILLGVLGILYKDTPFDKTLTVLSAAAVSIVQYVAALLLLLLFSVTLHWFPAVGTGDKGDVLDKLHHLILPATAMSISWIGYIQRIVREALAETLFSEYVKTAKSFGIPRGRIIYKYCLRNAVKPLVNIIVIGWGALLGGSFFIESIFGRKGLGRLILSALQAREYYAAQCGIIVAVVIFISAVILADIVNAIVDPRIRFT